MLLTTGIPRQRNSCKYLLKIIGFALLSETCVFSTSCGSVPRGSVCAPRLITHRARNHDPRRAPSLVERRRSTESPCQTKSNITGSSGTPRLIIMIPPDSLRPTREMVVYSLKLNKLPRLGGVKWFVSLHQTTGARSGVRNSCDPWRVLQF